MAITANRELSRYVDQELRSFAVAAAARIYKGAIVGVDRASGYVRNLVAGDVFAGIAYEEIDNGAGQNGDVSVRLYTQGDFILAASGATQAQVGGPVYALDNELTTVAPVVGGSYCGILMAIAGSNVGIVRIMPMAAPQVELESNVRLDSSLSAATTNPVLITQRAIKVLHAQVSFNSVPNSGALDVGTGNSTPNEVVSGFNLASLSANTPASLTINFANVAKGLRVWAKVGQASSTAGVGGLLSIRYIELP